ncbi:tRNA pseudouridine synthase A [compost metagenome]
MEIGRGKLDGSAAEGFLTELSSAPARLTAPSSGLFLERVYYENDARTKETAAVTPLIASKATAK